MAELEFGDLGRMGRFSLGKRLQLVRMCKSKYLKRLSRLVVDRDWGVWLAEGHRE